MTKKKAHLPATFPRKGIKVESGPSDDEKGRAFGILLNSPELAAFRVIQTMQPKEYSDEIDTPTMLATLRDQAAAVQRGDMARSEAMLASQASALQAIFVRLAERAMSQERMPHLEGFMRLALKAQGQCRATLETLAALKNPPIVYARQANVTTGPQQINNGSAAPRTREIETEQNQLSGRANELPQDARASGIASRTDSPLETLGEIDRAKVARR